MPFDKTDIIFNSIRNSLQNPATGSVDGMDQLVALINSSPSVAAAMRSGTLNFRISNVTPPPAGADYVSTLQRITFYLNGLNPNANSQLNPQQVFETLAHELGHHTSYLSSLIQSDSTATWNLAHERQLAGASVNELTSLRDAFVAGRYREEARADMAWVRSVMEVRETNPGFQPLNYAARFAALERIIQTGDRMVEAGYSRQAANEVANNLAAQVLRGDDTHWRDGAVVSFNGQYGTTGTTLGGFDPNATASATSLVQGSGYGVRVIDEADGGRTVITRQIIAPLAFDSNGAVINVGSGIQVRQTRFGPGDNPLSDITTIATPGGIVNTQISTVRINNRLVEVEYQRGGAGDELRAVGAYYRVPGGARAEMTDQASCVAAINQHNWQAEDLRKPDVGANLLISGGCSLAQQLIPVAMQDDGIVSANVPEALPGQETATLYASGYNVVALNAPTQAGVSTNTSAALVDTHFADRLAALNECRADFNTAAASGNVSAFTSSLTNLDASLAAIGTAGKAVGAAELNLDASSSRWSLLQSAERSGEDDDFLRSAMNGLGITNVSRIEDDAAGNLSGGSTTVTADDQNLGGNFDEFFLYNPPAPPPSGSGGTVIDFTGPITVDAPDTPAYVPPTEPVYTPPPIDFGGGFDFSFDFFPVVLDLDGDGYELSDAAHGIRADVNGDGILDYMGWVKPDDAILAYDANGDGIVTLNEIQLANFAPAGSPVGLTDLEALTRRARRTRCSLLRRSREVASQRMRHARATGLPGGERGKQTYGWQKNGSEGCSARHECNRVACANVLQGDGT